MYVLEFEHSLSWKKHENWKTMRYLAGIHAIQAYRRSWEVIWSSYDVLVNKALTQDCFVGYQVQATSDRVGIYTC